MWSALADSVTKLKADIETQLDAAVGEGPRSGVGVAKVYYDDDDEEEDAPSEASSPLSPQGGPRNLDRDAYGEEEEEDKEVGEGGVAVALDENSASSSAGGAADAAGGAEEKRKDATDPDGASSPPSPEHHPHQASLSQQDLAAGANVGGDQVETVEMSIIKKLSRSGLEPPVESSSNEAKKATVDEGRNGVAEEATISTPLASMKKGGGGDRPISSTRSSSSSSARKVDTQRKRCDTSLVLAQLRSELAEKDRIITAYQEEGQALAVKQSTLEQATRRARSELKGVKDERDRAEGEAASLSAELQEVKEQLASAVDEVRTQAKKIASLTVGMRNAEAKSGSLEEELSKLKACAASNTELERRLVATETARDLALGKANASESDIETFRREREAWGEREAALESSLVEAQRKAGDVEDALQSELATVRQRWNEAILRSERIAEEAHTSAAPLLAQIRSLQDEIRERQEAFAFSEAAITERAVAAERTVKDRYEACFEAEKRAASLAEEALMLRAELTSTQRELESARSEVNVSHSKCEDASSALTSLQVEFEALRGQVPSLERENTQLQSALKEKEAVEGIIEEKEAELSEALTKLSELEAELKEVISANKNLEKLVQEQKNNSEGSVYVSSPLLALPSHEEPPRDTRPETFLGASTPALLASSQSSFAAVETLQASLRKQEGDIMGLRARIDELEMLRDALTDEVTQLGRRSLDLESQAEEGAQLRLQVIDLERKNDLLLEMLGEREEEIEAMQAQLASQGLKQ